jgi:shikimate dehydrogenase
MPLLDRISNTSARLGAVNVIVRRGRELEGDNTDMLGFMRGLALLPVDLPGASVVVVGAGGAARAVVAGLSQAGANVQLFNRSQARALELLRDLGLAAGRLLDAAALPRAIEGAQLLVNTTTVGMHGGPEGLPIPAGVLPRAGAVVDLIYRPALTPLLRAARDAGAHFQNGLPMLVFQGVEAFTLWTGVTPPVDVMGWAAATALDGRVQSADTTWFDPVV